MAAAAAVGSYLSLLSHLLPLISFLPSCALPIFIMLPLCIEYIYIFEVGSRCLPKCYRDQVERSMQRG